MKKTKIKQLEKTVHRLDKKQSMAIKGGNDEAPIIGETNEIDY